MKDKNSSIMHHNKISCQVHFLKLMYKDDLNIDLSDLAGVFPRLNIMTRQDNPKRTCLRSVNTRQVGSVNLLPLENPLSVDECTLTI